MISIDGRSSLGVTVKPKAAAASDGGGNNASHREAAPSRTLVPRRNVSRKLAARALRRSRGRLRQRLETRATPSPSADVAPLSPPLITAPIQPLVEPVKPPVELAFPNPSPAPSLTPPSQLPAPSDEDNFGGGQDAPQPEPSFGGLSHDRDTLSVRPPHRWEGARRRLPLMLGVTLVAALVLVSLLPVYLLSRARRRSVACFDEVLSARQRTPDACVPSASELSVASWVPWLETEALLLRTSAQERALGLAYDQATAVTPSHTARQQAATALLDRQARVGLAPPLAALVEEVPGAFDTLGKVAKNSADKEVRRRGLKLARALADREALVSLSRGGDVTDPFRLNLERGATLCLQHLSREGISALVHADRGHRVLSPQGNGYALARLAMLACGEWQPAGELDPRLISAQYRAALTALEAVTGDHDGGDAAGVLLLDPAVSMSGSERLRLSAFVLRQQRIDALVALSLLYPRHGLAAVMDDAALMSPWTATDSAADSHAVMVEPLAARQAAQHLTSLLREMGEKPLSCAGQECPTDVALSMPREQLRQAASMLWLSASQEQLRRGQWALAKRDAEEALALSSNGRRHQVAALLLRGGHGKAALAVLAPQFLMFGGEQSGVVRIAARLIQAQAHAHQGHMAEAYNAAEKAFLTNVSPAGQSRDELDAWRHSAAWVWAAMALATGRTDHALAALAPVAEIDDEVSVVVEWMQLATQPESQRRLRRSGFRIAIPPPSARPAVVFVVGMAAPRAEVEVWLDRLFDAAHRAEPASMMTARAEAARWRGDDLAEGAWRDRAARLSEQVDGYPSALLATLAGLR